MKKLHLVLFAICFILCANNAQDIQWFIKDSKIKTGFNGTTNTYSTLVSSVCGTGNILSIDGVTHPSASTRNDVFIIFGDGTYYDSRNIISSPFIGSGSNGYSLTVSKCSQIHSLYFTNIYDGDDPPSNVSLSNNTLNYSVNINGFISPSNITANHDIVSGKEVTIIIPNSLFEDTIQCPTNSSLSLTFDDQLLDPAPIFNNYFSFHNQLNYNPGRIINISRTVPYHFINFKVIDPMTGYASGQTTTFKLWCDNTEIGSHSETIRDVHDPNYIEVKCIFKRNGKYVIMYHVQFMNEGSAAVSDVMLNFKLPNIINFSAPINVANWKYSNKSGCGTQKVIFTQYLNELKFYFYKNNIGVGLAAHLSTIADNDKTGWIEFCVETNLTTLEQIYKADLMLTDPTTQFNQNKYGIVKFIDPKINCDIVGIPKGRQIKNNCTCRCTPSLTPVPLQSNPRAR